jgi:hypothetical protein
VPRISYRLAPGLLLAPRPRVLAGLTKGGSGLDFGWCQREQRPPQPDGIPGSGTGLIGVGERARLAGGRIEFGPTGTGEFRLRAWLPWAA